MHLACHPLVTASWSSFSRSTWPARVSSLWIVVSTVSLWLITAHGMSDGQMASLRRESVDMFYHGYDNYIKHAFPEDELRPITCTPLTRDRENPSHVEINDALGNYSLTLIDSLSTLAILASSRDRAGPKALRKFQDAVSLVVKTYGDGTEGRKGQGTRARGFDIDSKVQVFETVIRGLGGLLSAHLFAVGDLPIRGYTPRNVKSWKRGRSNSGSLENIRWPNGLTYNGQLLRLAHDLGNRLLPAFYTSSGMPYPRVNLRQGIPFYNNSPLHFNAEYGQCPKAQPSEAETTETCSAGAGSLVLEFSTLSRLTGDGRFEQLAKRAFWSIWSRRSTAGLIGAGIDAETGQWIGAYTGIGAGIDSFFEYAMKSHVLLSGLDPPNMTVISSRTRHAPYHPDDLYPPLSVYDNAADTFLSTWHEAHGAIRRHIYRGQAYHHPHYLQGDLYTGATRAFWIDSLSAYYPGLLTLAGELDEAIEAHLLHTALWTRYSALPERWSVASGSIEGGLKWWGGRPEFIESTYHLYRATKDPWYLHVGEMAMRDIKRRCWTKCGWAGIQDVRTGEQTDRMESFFLGETTKYLFLLFDSAHPLNTIDAPYVFNTEGHPLIIPRHRKPDRKHRTAASPEISKVLNNDICPIPPANIPFSISATAARKDIYHASSLARLHLVPKFNVLESSLVEFSDSHPSITISDLRSPSNHSFYPWTLPPYLMPVNGTSAKIATRPTFDISFPVQPNTVLGLGTLQRVHNGILVNNLGGLRVGLVLEDPDPFDTTGRANSEHYRVYSIGNIPLGRDERLFVPKDVLSSMVAPTDPNFTLVKDSALLDVIIESTRPTDESNSTTTNTASTSLSASPESSLDFSSLDQSPDFTFNNDDASSDDTELSDMKAAFNNLLSHVTNLLREHSSPASPHKSTTKQQKVRDSFPAILPVGIGAAPLPEVEDAPPIDNKERALSWTRIYITDELCDEVLPPHIPKEYQVIVVKRGKCIFSQKLANIPHFDQTRDSALKLVVVVSFPEHDPLDDEGNSLEGLLVRPLLDEEQVVAQQGAIAQREPPVEPESKHHIPECLKNGDSGAESDGGGDGSSGDNDRRSGKEDLPDATETATKIKRDPPISMLMIAGGQDMMDRLTRVDAMGVRRRYEIRSRGVVVSNLVVL